jgi:hypothetical protein
MFVLMNVVPGKRRPDAARLVDMLLVSYTVPHVSGHQSSEVNRGCRNYCRALYTKYIINTVHQLLCKLGVEETEFC